MSTRQKLEKKEYIPKAWEAVDCPFCQHNDFRKLETFGDKRQYTHVHCNNCRLVYLNPRPKYDDEFVHDAYEFYADNDERYAIDDNFYERESHFEKIEVAEIIKHDLKRTALLDIGCAVGKFLYRARPYYNSCTGLDVSKRMAATVKEKLDINVMVGKFEHLTFDEKFSCINMSHVLEHYPHPHLWLEKVKNLLAPEGILVISVPNMFSADRIVKRYLKIMGLAKNNWESWRTPDHLFEPTIPALLWFLNKQEFEIIDYYTYSRKKLKTDSILGKSYHKKLKLGSNMKFILKAQKC